MALKRLPLSALGVLWLSFGSNFSEFILHCPHMHEDPVIHYNICTLTYEPLISGQKAYRHLNYLLKKQIDQVCILSHFICRPISDCTHSGSLIMVGTVCHCKYIFETSLHSKMDLPINGEAWYSDSAKLGRNNVPDAMFVKRRFRSACASALSDHNLCCPRGEDIGLWLPIQRPVKTQIRLRIRSETSLSTHG